VGRSAVWGVGRSAAWGVAVILALTLPGMVFTVQRYRSIVVDETQGGTLTASEQRAMRWLSQSAASGGVLAPALIGAAVPEETGRHTWVGHASTTPDYYARAAIAEALFDGRLTPLQVRPLVALAHVRFLLSDCRGRARIDPQLGPLLGRALPFGCAVVYELRG
jgi:hypothetical protein